MYIYIYIHIYNTIYISGQKSSTTHRVLKSHRIKMGVTYGNICLIVKTMCSPGYPHNGFLETHALGHMMYMMYIELSHCI